jgi:hypothetical protein
LGLTEAQRSAITSLELDESDLSDLFLHGSGLITDMTNKYQLSNVCLLKVSIRSLRKLLESGLVGDASMTSGTLRGLQATLQRKLSEARTADISFRFSTILNEDDNVDRQEHDNERMSDHKSEVDEGQSDDDNDGIVWESDIESDTNNNTSDDSDGV